MFQFFITLGEDLDYLDGKHTVFGEVAEGFEVLDKLNDAYCDEHHRPYRDIRFANLHSLLKIINFNLHFFKKLLLKNLFFTVTKYYIFLSVKAVHLYRVLIVLSKNCLNIVVLPITHRTNGWMPLLSEDFRAH